MSKRLLLLALAGLVLTGGLWAQESQVDVSTGHAAKKKTEPLVPSKEIEWVTSLDQGMKLAAETRRPLIAYFTYDT